MTAAGPVHAVVVTFRPDWQRMERALHALASQVERIFIVDNGAQAGTLRALAERVGPASCAVLSMNGNEGMASAQNRGIEEALLRHAEHVLLLDDDSIPAGDMVAKLLAASRSAAAEGQRIAAAGPVYEEERTGAASYFVHIGRLGLRRLRCNGDPQAVFPCDLLISSGSLLSSVALREIGGMDAALFIDHVDTEWCLRARSQGYGLLGVCGARMSHRLGEDTVRVTSNRQLSIHNPDRYYYIFRNSVLLYARGYPVWRWKVADSLRLVKLLAGIAVYVRPCGKALGAALLGLSDGLRRRTGPKPGARA